MASATVAGVYATALLDLAQERGVAPALVAAAPVVAAAFTRDVIQALEKPGLESSVARQALAGALADAPDELRSLALLLLERGRLAALPAILADVVSLFEQRHGVVHVTVTTAAPLSAQAEQSVSQVLHKTLGPGARIVPQVDPRLLGGVTLRFGDTLVDGSVRRSLDEMKAAMLNISVSGNLWATA